MCHIHKQFAFLGKILTALNQSAEVSEESYNPQTKKKTWTIYERRRENLWKVWILKIRSQNKSNLEIKMKLILSLFCAIFITNEIAAQGFPPPQFIAVSRRTNSFPLQKPFLVQCMILMFSFFSIKNIRFKIKYVEIFGQSK